MNRKARNVAALHEQIELERKSTDEDPGLRVTHRQPYGLGRTIKLHTSSFKACKSPPSKSNTRSASLSRPLPLTPREAWPEFGRNRLPLGHHEVSEPLLPAISSRLPASGYLCMHTQRMSWPTGAHYNCSGRHTDGQSGARSAKLRSGHPESGLRRKAMELLMNQQCATHP